MTDATELDEAAIRARLEAATPGPWVVFDMDDAEKRKDEPLNEPGQGWYWVWSEPRLPYYGAVLEPERDHPAAIGSTAINDSEGGAQEQADAEFIAHARTDVGLLLTALDEARADFSREFARGMDLDTELVDVRIARDKALARAEAAEVQVERLHFDLDREARARQAAEQERDLAEARSFGAQKANEILRARAEAAEGALAKAWDEGAKCAGSYGHEDDWTHEMHPFDDNPYRATAERGD